MNMISSAAYQSGMDALTAAGMEIPDWYRNISVGSPTYQPRQLADGSIELKPGHIVKDWTMDQAMQNSPYLNPGWDSLASLSNYGSQGQYGGASNSGLSSMVSRQARQRHGGKDNITNGTTWNNGMNNPSYGYSTPPPEYGGSYQDPSSVGTTNSPYPGQVNSQYQAPASNGTQQPWQDPNSVYQPPTNYNNTSQYNPNAPTSQSTISKLGYDPKPFNSLSGQAAYDYYDKISQQNPYVPAPTGYGDYMTQKTGNAWVDPNPDTMDFSNDYYSYFDNIQKANPNTQYATPRGYNTWLSQQQT
jgi:hypothetical protein